MRRVPSKQRNAKIHHDRDVRALSRLALLLFCGLLLAGGFVFAAQQHFAAVQFGYQSEGLRREREKLLHEQQHLMLMREQAFAPARLESEARELGSQAFGGRPDGNSESRRTEPTTAGAGFAQSFCDVSALIRVGRLATLPLLRGASARPSGSH